MRALQSAAVDFRSCRPWEYRSPEIEMTATLFLRLLVIVIVALAIFSAVFHWLTWTAIALAFGISLLAPRIELVVARHRAKQVEFDRYRARAMARDTLRGHEFDGEKRETPPV
jgi:ABC-type transport system involved in cytochrome bd biosynthesis fused ATPase/permease subunit